MSLQSACSLCQKLAEPQPLLLGPGLTAVGDSLFNRSCCIDNTVMSTQYWLLNICPSLPPLQGLTQRVYRSSTTK